LAGRWTHSFEEDHDGITVYRRADFTFPPARGRRGVEFRPDGTFTELSPGRADAPEPSSTGRLANNGALLRGAQPTNAAGAASAGGMPGGAGMNSGAAAAGTSVGESGRSPTSGVAGRVVRAAPDRLEIVWE
jgi:hypothetical protein